MSSYEQARRVHSPFDPGIIIILRYEAYLEGQQGRARKNAAEMDLENVALRQSMSQEAEEIETAVADALDKLRRIHFE